MCNRKDYLKLLRFIDWLINLPEKYEKIYCEEMKKFEEMIKMPYITTFERYGYKKGLKEGREKGIEKGMEKGKIDTAAKMLKKDLDIDIIAECTGLQLNS